MDEYGMGQRARQRGHPRHAHVLQGRDREAFSRGGTPVPADAHGYQVMSLRELIAALQTQARDRPQLLDMPVWTANMQPLHFPVQRVYSGGQGVHLVFERGGS